MKNSRQGFTLIEILIVIAIIAILASIVLVGLGPTQQAGRDARRLSDLREVQNGLELYFGACGYYPGGAFPATGCAGVAPSQVHGWANLTLAITSSTALGIPTVPNDPSAASNGSYDYGTTNNEGSYIIAAKLENANNSVFTNYVAPSMTGYTMTISSCAKPEYCITL